MIQNWDKMSKDIKDIVETEVNIPILEQKMPIIQAIADEAVDILADGFQWEDVLSMYQIIGPLMNIAGDIEELDDKAKEQFVVDAVWLIYKTIDTYPDGESNRINIPVLFGGLETAFEKKALDFATRAAVNAVYKFAKDQGWAFTEEK
jgi:hypothetical protein